MYRFALHPKWMVLHVLVLAVLACFVVAGFWQLRRLDERRERNAVISERRADSPRSLDDVLADGDYEHRRVRVRGTYDLAREVVLFGRDFDKEPGHHLLTPLRIDDDQSIVVDRGWIPIDTDRADPPSGTVTVTGVLSPSETGGSRPTSVDGGRREVAKADVSELGAGRLIADDVYLLLQSQSPAQPRSLPGVVPLAQLSAGPHRGYAIQWFLFAAALVAVYTAMLRREARRNR